ncbi:MAG: hypothetical protein EP335_10170 [Alphaproteobacteria bacterium]|nr:MAG: hypothetical protein EP335_10170 [Alphaproteobacteria bacterium]
MARVRAALTREQGITFVVVAVKDHVVLNSSLSDQMIQAAISSFGCGLVVLMGERNRRLQGNRRDVVNFVASIHPSRLPWKDYSF